MKAKKDRASQKNFLRIFRDQPGAMITRSNQYTAYAKVVHKVKLLFSNCILPNAVRQARGFYCYEK